jgi:hypothetical protein
MSTPTRHLFAAGMSQRAAEHQARVADKEVAVKCAWCNRWKSADDALAHSMGKPTSHGLCETCEREQFGSFVDDPEEWIRARLPGPRPTPTNSTPNETDGPGHPE